MRPRFPFPSPWFGLAGSLLLAALPVATSAAASASAAGASGAESQCYGTVGHGRIEHSVSLPPSGPHFEAYSTEAVAAGRAHVHSRVSEVVQAAYAAAASAQPGVTYVYGETGLAKGGRFAPHHTHQNGLSVDFMVPVRDATGQPATLPRNGANRFGYDIEFDAQGRWRDYRIDFPALAEHLAQLHQAAQARGVGLALVIFDKPFLPQLLATPRGAYLRQHLNFMKGQPWVRHDEHYHVDFAVPCLPYAA